VSRERPDVNLYAGFRSMAAVVTRPAVLCYPPSDFEIPILTQPGR
jgi:hypothetical protein